jgi:thioredoxin-dependent peroxiredoxin
MASEAYRNVMSIPAHTRATRAVAGAVGGLFRTLRLWAPRWHRRRELLNLGSFMLDDLGLTRDEVLRVCIAPPWQPFETPRREVFIEQPERKMLKINDEAPNFTAATTHGPINFHEWIGDGWAVLFSHPKDFTPVCTTELGSMAKLSHEFTRRNCKVVGLSLDSVDDHIRWTRDIEASQGHKVDFPLIGDRDLAVAKLYGMLPAGAGDTATGRTAADNATVRSTFVIGPDRTIKLMFTYPMSTGRNFAELLRVLDSVQLTAKHKLATPANWHPGDDVIIVPAVSDEDARKKFPNGWTSPTPYMRVVPQPLD